MICSRCGARVTDGKRFCGDCGSPLPWQCNACGSENPPGKRFCADCGAAQGAAAASRESSTSGQVSQAAERRQLTIVFVDLVNSTRLSAQLDPEDLRAVMATYHHCVTGLVGRFGGIIARYMGDGVLAYFGYPRAHEDDAERAILASLASVEAVNRLPTIAGPAGTLTARAGIATGLVVVGDLIGAGSSLEQAVVGDTPNLAARLQSLAEPGSVVVADTTRQLVGSLFEYHDLGPISVKGLDRPIHPWSVLGESRIESRFEALRSGQAPLVNRSEEIDLLMRRWEQSKAGEGRVVLVSGEPGIGKSRLTAELERRISYAPHSRIRLVCSAPYHDTPMHPIIRQLERSARFERGDSPVVKRDKLRALFVPGALSETEIAIFADLLAVPGTEDDLPKNLTPKLRKEMTFAAMCKQLEGLSQRMPVLMVFEDIHWADASTIDFINLLIGAVDRLPILVVITTRPEQQPIWITLPQVTVQVLNGLNRQHATSLISDVSADRNLPLHLVEQIVARADGVPLFIEELTKTVVEGGERRRKIEREVQEAVSAESVPLSLQASLMARLDRLTAGKEVAQIGSVIGRDFSFELLERLSGMPRGPLEIALGELAQSGLVIADGRPPDATYGFKHALVQDAAYASLLRERRREIHLRLAELLEKDAVHGLGAEPQLLAWHFGEAGAPDKAIDYYLKAAEKATGRYALAEMVSHLRKGLHQLENLPYSPEKSQRELALQVGLGRALIDHQGSGSEEVRIAFERARELCLALNDTDRLLRVHDGLLNYHFTHSDPAVLLGYARELLDVGQRSANVQAFLMAKRSAGFANLLLGRLDEARRELESLVAIYDVERDGPQSGLTTRDVKVSASTVLGMCLTALGYPDSGDAMSLQGVRHAEAIHHRVSLFLGLRRACVQRMMQGDAGGVLDLSSRILTSSAEYEVFLGSREGVIFNSWAQLKIRRDAAHLERLQTCLSQLDAAKHWVMLPFFMTCAADVMGGFEDRPGAAALLDRAAELADLTGEQWSTPEILRLQAQIGDHSDEEKVRLLQASLAMAREQNAKLWELRSAVSLAKLLCDRTDHAAARGLLAPLLGWFVEGFKAPDLVAAKALLDACDRS